MAAVELGSKEFWDRLSEDPRRLAREVCNVDLTRLELMLQYQASLRAWVNAAHEVAKIEESTAEYEVTKARARALLKAKEEKDPHTEKAKIQEVLKAEVEIDVEVIRLTDVLLDAQRKRGALRAMTTGLEDRSQMLMQLSANQRKERNDTT